LRFFADERPIADPRTPNPHAGKVPGFIPFIDPFKAAEEGNKVAGPVGGGLATAGASTADIIIGAANVAIGFGKLGQLFGGTAGPPRPSPVLSVSLGDKPTTRPIPADLDGVVLPLAKPGDVIRLGGLELRCQRAKVLPKAAGKPKRLEVVLSVKNPTADVKTLVLPAAVSLLDDGFRRAKADAPPQKDALESDTADWPFYDPREVRQVKLVFPVEPDAKTFHLRVSDPIALSPKPVYLPLKP
jgi:hypothetical protein